MGHGREKAKRIICFESTLDLRTVIERLAIDHFEIRKFEKHDGSHLNAGCWTLTLLWTFY